MLDKTTSNETSAEQMCEADAKIDVEIVEIKCKIPNNKPNK